MRTALKRMASTAWGEPPVAADLGFLALTSSRVVRDARASAAASPAGPGSTMSELIAGGTLDALLWALGTTDRGPASGRLLAAPSVQDLRVEAVSADEQRMDAEKHSELRCYTRGIADGCSFAAGMRSSFWWVPSPEGLRMGPPRRDEFGRTPASPGGLTGHGCTPTRYEPNDPSHRKGWRPLRLTVAGHLVDHRVRGWSWMAS